MIMEFEKGPFGRIRRLRELLTGMSRSVVLLAFQALASEVSPDRGYGDSTNYDLIHEGHAYL